MFLQAVEILLVLLGVIVLVTQVIIPVFRGSVLFPFFFTKQDELEEELSDVVQHREEDKLKATINSLKEEK